MAFNSEFSVLSSTIKNVIVELKMAAMFLDYIMQIENMVSGGGEWRGGGGSANLNLFLLFVIIFGLSYRAVSLVKVLANVGAFRRIQKTQLKCKRLTS